MIKMRQKILVAVSGGVDSVALLHMLNKWQSKIGITLCAAHLDHMFRGDESQADAAFVQEICAKWGIPCVVEAIDVPKHMEKYKLSAQAAAREVRYSFLERSAENFGADLIALAHHADDQAETVLMNLIRGSGMKGISGIDPIRNKRYLRPLIKARRKEIERYCDHYKIEYREDSSNKKPIYLRNKIRMHLIPFLESKYNPRIVDVLCRLADISRLEDDYLLMEAQKTLNSLVCNSSSLAITLNREGFQRIHTAIKRRVVRLAWERLTGKQGLSFERIDQVLKHIDSIEPKSIEMPFAVECIIAYSKLEFRIKQKTKIQKRHVQKLNIPGRTLVGEGVIIASIYDRKDFYINPIELPKNEAVLDYNRTGKRLFVRTREAGDVFKPFGMNNYIKLKKFFIDQKIPKARRDEILLICNENEIVWICGFRIGEDFKITRDTEEVLHLRFIRQR